MQNVGVTSFFSSNIPLQFTFCEGLFCHYFGRKIEVFFHFRAWYAFYAKGMSSTLY